MTLFEKKLPPEVSYFTALKDKLPRVFYFINTTQKHLNYLAQQKN